MSVDIVNQKWSYIEQLAIKPQSPLELAQQLNTSIANISMQLKILEAAGLVLKTRTKNSAAGQPRLVYKLTKDIAQISIAESLLQKKQLIDLDAEKKTIFRIWQLPIYLHGPLIHFMYTNLEYFSDAHQIYVGEYNEQACKIIVSNEKYSSEKKNTSNKTVTINHRGKKIIIEISFKTIISITQQSNLIRIH